MALTIATNLFALDTQNAIANNQQPLAQAMEQLSTGLKINTAADNSAGLAIATRMQLQINGYAQDVNNANNGIDFVQTAEGAVTGMTNNLQTIYELANQSASYNTSSDRGDMNDEVQQLLAQLNSTVSQTEYNQSTFLNQNYSASFQVGNEVGQTITVSTTNLAPSGIGQIDASITDFSSSANALQGIANAAGYSTVTQGLIASAGLAAAANLNGISLGTGMTASMIINNSTNVLNAINAISGQTNIKAFSFGNADVASSIYVATNVTISTAGGTIGADYLTINGVGINTSVTIGTAAGVTDASSIMANIGSAINAYSSTTGVTAEVLGSAFTGASGQYTIALVNTTGNAISVTVATADLNLGTTVGWTDPFGTNGNNITAGQNGQIVFTTTTSGVNAVFDAAGSAHAAGASATTVNLTSSGSLNSLNVSTNAGANLAILQVEAAINTMNSAQANLGAYVNRFNSAITETQSDSTNITAAKSSFMDADYAAATSNLTTSMITQQAGIAMLAQANTLPQQVLTLLPKT